MGTLTTSQLLASLVFFPFLVHCWPDGSPCLRHTLEDMTPSGYFHEGGLNESVPAPYRIRLNSTCYWPYAAVSVLLQAVPGETFKGFAIQARDPQTGERRGEVLRDNNGAWQYQCFKNHAALTHANNWRKTDIPFSWMANERHHYGSVQFVATVVEGGKNYWVKGVQSALLPRCRSNEGPSVPEEEKKLRREDLQRGERFDRSRPIPVDPRVCQLPFDEGVRCGEGWRPVFVFASGFCSPFYYGGCGGNENRFPDLRSCVRLCYGQTIGFGK